MVEQRHQCLCTTTTTASSSISQASTRETTSRMSSSSMAHDGHRHGNRDQRDGEQHFDGRAGNQAPGQDHDQVLPALPAAARGAGGARHRIRGGSARLRAPARPRNRARVVRISAAVHSGCPGSRSQRGLSGSRSDSPASSRIREMAPISKREERCRNDHSCNHPDPPPAAGWRASVGKQQQASSGRHEPDGPTARTKRRS